MTSDTQIRLLLVEDVAQVSQYVRNLLSHQEHVKLLDVVTDGRVVLDQIRELRPDVLMVDALLQGKVNGLAVAERVRQAGLGLPIIVLTVPQKPVKAGAGMGIVRVLTMPFSGYELMNALNSTAAEYRAQAPDAASRSIAVHAPKGGVGRTTVAYNLAVSFGQASGMRVVLVDGNMQYGDLRGLLRVPDDAPSILQLPTDRISESDLGDVLWRDPSGIDILLAPPRLELAEMVTARDLAKVLSLLRRIYNVVVLDTPPMVDDLALTLLDDADVIVEIVTPDWPALRNAALVSRAFGAIGYPPEKMVLVLNRAVPGPRSDPRAIAEQTGRAPEFAIADDTATVGEADAQGVPFVIAKPKAPVSQHVQALARALLARPITAAPQKVRQATRMARAST